MSRSQEEGSELLYSVRERASKKSQGRKRSKSRDPQKEGGVQIRSSSQGRLKEKETRKPVGTDDEEVVSEEYQNPLVTPETVKNKPQPVPTIGKSIDQQTPINLGKTLSLGVQDKAAKVLVFDHEDVTEQNRNKNTKGR